MENRLVFKKFHRIVRLKAKNEKNFFKLINYSVFGKTCENVRQHKDIKLVCTEPKRKKYFSKVNFKYPIWFSDRLTAMNMQRIEVFINRPIYLGHVVLDLSKIVMYKFY